MFPAIKTERKVVQIDSNAKFIEAQHIDSGPPLTPVGGPFYFNHHTKDNCMSNNQTALEEALTHEKGFVRIQARAADSQWAASLAEWIGEELKRPDFNAADMAHGLFAALMQVHAAFSAFAFRPDAKENLIGLMHSIIDRQYGIAFDMHSAANTQGEVPKPE
jgi:hypothetical protein